MLDGPTPWFVLRRRLGSARRRVLVVALTLLLASAASAAGAERYARAAAVASPAAMSPAASCGAVARGAGLAMVPDHSRQLPAPGLAEGADQSAGCRRVKSLVPRQGPAGRNLTP